MAIAVLGVGPAIGIVIDRLLLRRLDGATAATYVVVSLGLDAAATDPESPLRVTGAGYHAAGRLVAALGPAVLIQEGGYDLASLGGLAVAAVSGAAEGAGLRASS